MSTPNPLFLTEDDAADQAYPFDPTTADRQATDAARARERTVRADQTRRVVRELERLGQDYAVTIARLVTPDPGW